jgi:exopolyphosphatase/guanosine-5'-triphosphate,3'-diphosphate pyrophosphatase
MPRAAIDVGSNSLLLLIQADDGTVLHDEARVVGLGRGLGDRGLFRPDRLALAEETLQAFLDIARRHGLEPWQIRAVATSAARRAMNAETWTQRVRARWGLNLKVLSGEDEARYTSLGALRDLTLPSGPVLVIDLGGGSTELVLTEGQQVQLRRSIELGSARLTEQFLEPLGPGGTYDPANLARLRNHVEVELSSLRIEPRPRTVLAVAGTATTLAALRLGLTQYDREAVHGTTLTRADLASLMDQLLPTTSEARRRLVQASPDRADALLAGATVLDRLLEISRRQAMTVSDRGLRYGLLEG